ECGTVLTAGGFEPPVPGNADHLPEPVLKALASKETGPPPPKLDAAARRLLSNTGDIMNRFALLMALFSAVGCGVWATRADAFDTNSENLTSSDATAGFRDPDDQIAPGLLQVAPD